MIRRYSIILLLLPCYIPLAIAEGLCDLVYMASVLDRNKMLRAKQRIIETASRLSDIIRILE